MKRALLGTCSLLLLIATYAQPSVSLKGGLNLSWMVNGNFLSKKMRAGVQFGVVAQQPVSTHFFFQPELLYSGKGYRFQTPVAEIEKSVLRLNYLSLPLLLGFKVNEKLSLLFGPEVDYLLAAAWDAENSAAFKDKGFSAFDAGLDVGFTYQITKKTGLDLRYSHGFNMFYRTDYDYDVVNKGANRVVQLGFHYRLK